MIDRADVLDRPHAAAAANTSTDWLPPKLVERMLGRRGRLHTFETLDPVCTALVVIDLTILFAGEAASAPAVIGNVNRLAVAVRGGGGLVAWVMPLAASYDDLAVAILGAGPAAHYRAATAAGDPRAALHPDLQPSAEDWWAWKSGYSAFWPGACDLRECLIARGIDTVLIAGAVSNVCCEASARDAHSCGFRVVMLADANIGKMDEHRAALAAVYRNFGDVRTVDETVALLASKRNAQPSEGLSPA
jgi:nicotinamidase-related amidase